MQLTSDETLRIPVQATYQVDGSAITCTSAEYAEISAEDFARFLLRGFGACTENSAPAAF